MLSKSPGNLALLCYLIALACGPLSTWTTAAGQDADPTAQAWLAKLRSLETFANSSSRSGGITPDADSSLADPPSPQRLAELLELVLSPNPPRNLLGRHRFLVVDESPRGKLRSQKLTEALESAGLLDQWLSILDDPSNAGVNAEALKSLVNRNPEDVRSAKANSENSIQIKRSSANFPLLGWGPGTYQSARSEHFAIASQAGDKPTTEVAQACELIFSIWQSLFGDRFELPKQPSPAFRIVLFRNREAYVRALKAIEPRISISTGYYSSEHRIAFFYWDGPKSFPTLVHELTHQFFDATSSDDSRFDPDNDAGAWAVEAAALYMESWSEEYVGAVRVIDIGGWDAPRLQAGRFRRLRDQYWIPWEEFSMADGKHLRADPDVAAWYSQACGLAHYWLDADPATRETFLNYLQEVYKGNGVQAAKGLIDDETLRTSYDQYLLTGSNPAGDPATNYARRPGLLRRNELVLTRCPIENPTLLSWPLGLRKLAWLDVGFTKVDDELFSQTTPYPWDIAKLSLESTAITDASIKSIAQMRNLTELDLSGCKVTDAGLELLAKHPTLKQLWLTNTQVTDRSIDVLASIPKLERLEASGSLSVEGYQELLKKKPRLKKP